MSSVFTVSIASLFAVIFATTVTVDMFILSSRGLSGREAVHTPTLLPFFRVKVVEHHLVVILKLKGFIAAERFALPEYPGQVVFV